MSLWTSGVIAIVSAAIALLALPIAYRQYRDQKKPPASEFDINVGPMIDDDAIREGFFKKAARPSYMGKFLVRQGNVTLCSCTFYIKQASGSGDVVVHACPGKFDSEREMPTLGAGEGVIAVPADKRHVRDLLAEAISIRVEFHALSGQIYRSSELELNTAALRNPAAAGAP
jgi:hypothetical protein